MYIEQSMASKQIQEDIYESREKPLDNEQETH